MNTITQISANSPAIGFKSGKTTKLLYAAKKAPVADTFASQTKASKNSKLNLKTLILIAMAALSAGSVFTSCEDPNEEQVSVHMNVHNEVNVNIDWNQLRDVISDAVSSALATQTQELKGAMLELLTFMQTWKGDQDAKLDTILDKLTDLGLSMSDIVQLLTHQGVKLDAIQALLQQNNLHLTDLSNGQQNIAAILQSIENKVDQGLAISQSGNALLTNILTAVLDIQNNTNSYSQNYLSMLQSILNAINNMNTANQQAYADVLAKLDLMNNNMQSSLASVVSAITTMDSNVQAGILSIINHMNNHDTVVIGMLDDIKTQLQTMDSHQQQAASANINKLDQILQAIQNNGALINQAKALLADLVDNGVVLNGKANEIISLLTLLSQTPQGSVVDLTNIENKLDAISAKLSTNNTILQDINDKMDFIRVAVDGIRLQINSFGAQNHSDLLAILDAIEAKDYTNCNCTCDCNRIIELLEEILEEVKHNPNGTNDNNHEGIRNEYGDVLG